MHTILVANLKGGCGKTTFATTLASACAARDGQVALADADRQKSSLRWLKTRPETARLITALDWTRSVEDGPKGMSHLIIDAPGGLKGDKAEDLVELADLVVIPVLPSVFDIHSTQRFIERIQDLKAVRKGRTGIALAINRARLRTRALTETETTLTGLQHPTSAVITDRGLYAELARDGLALFDVEGRAYDAAKAQWTGLITAIHAL